MIGNHWSIPPGFDARCEICFELIKAEVCATDSDGQKWDVCKGRCAEQAGIK